ncbi:5-(carboxyamino)imidazole ribonucleotide synthase [Tyzzerella sp. An114]|uniref:5-(carboxyamino)imidazole ribonucleotide synthase n=1 Tax=Tyzzerella sp. An114 TaxID=1965545 RepID=UPI000B43F194|nr:5-(carboxyamino)imidazole ribonucleotide synthase [Tyzzerella sp. An114]OUQ58775.1 5-(carboxyamino)imidazole ribonucleotide synthase [Tyzzerella sp. An114]
MENIEKRIGIIGGGQLGKMMIQEAKKMGFYITVLDPTLKCPAHTLVDEHIVADFDDETAIRLLASKSDVITYEFEHIGADILEQLENEGVKVYPTAKSLKIIQNKYTQKSLLFEHNIPMPEFMAVKTTDDIKNAGEKYGYPFLLKSCTGGYDGKGNFVIHSENEISEGFKTLGGGKLPLMAEKFFPFTMEISVLACRGINGEIEVYPVAENIHHDNILFETRVPANISEDTSKKAMALAKSVMEIFEGVGMFCVEMFVDKEGNVEVNEVAPRPHNSGHYTIEACMTSQFEQHIRAVSGLPLGSSELLKPVVMRNILGSMGYMGDAKVIGADEALKIKGAYLHIYGKEKSVPKRKMGHLTVIANTLKEAEEKAEEAFNAVKIIGKERL